MEKITRKEFTEILTNNRTILEEENLMKWKDYVAKNGIEPCIRDENGYIVAWCVGYSEEELKNLLKKHPEWYFSSAKVS